VDRKSTGLARILVGWMIAPAIGAVGVLLGSLFLVESPGHFEVGWSVLYSLVAGGLFLVGAFVSGVFVAIGIRSLCGSGQRPGMVDYAMHIPPAWLLAALSFFALPGTALKVTVPAALCAVSYVPLFPHRRDSRLNSMQERIGRAATRLNPVVVFSETLLVRCTYICAFLCMAAAGLLLFAGGYGLIHVYPTLALFTMLVVSTSAGVLPLLLGLGVWSLVTGRMSRACFWLLFLPFWIVAASALVAGVMLAR
jgi:hypothetical protein